jgi:hypothetical protein
MQQEGRAGSEGAIFVTGGGNTYTRSNGFRLWPTFGAAFVGTRSQTQDARDLHKPIQHSPLLDGPGLACLKQHQALKARRMHASRAQQPV